MDTFWVKLQTVLNGMPLPLLPQEILLHFNQLLPVSLAQLSN